MEETGLDLSALDPTSNDDRWQSFVAATAERCWRARMKDITVTHLLVRWATPCLWLSAAAAALVWLAALSILEEESNVVAASATDPTVEMARWASSGEVPETQELLAVLEGYHGTK